MKTATITDTNSGIFPSEADRLGVFSIGMPVLIDGVAYTEGVDLTHEEFFRKAAEGSPVTTSQPSPGTVSAVWDQVLSQGFDQVVYIPMSSGLSHSYDTAQMLASEYGGKVSMADCRSISVTQRAAVLDALAMARSGMPAAHIKSRLELERDLSSIYLIVDSVDCLVRGGRVTPAAAKLATALNIKPLLTIQGNLIEPYSKGRGMKKTLAKMLDAAKRDSKKKLGVKDNEQLFVGVAGAGLPEEKEEELLAQAQEEFPGATVVYDKLPLSVAVHTGPGAVGIGVHAISQV